MKSLAPLLLVILLAAGCGTPSFLVTPVNGVYRLEETTVRDGKGWTPGKIAIIEVEGMLLNARTGGLLAPTENKVSLFAEELEKAGKDSSVKAVVLRVNSPGGTVAASEAMYGELIKFKQTYKKPVVTSIQDIGASGAYYLACGSDAIVAQPTSLVGSVGVIFERFDASGTMSKIGLKAETFHRGDMKDMGSLFRPVKDDERQVIQALVDEFYENFKDVVIRHRPIDALKGGARFADSRIFSGRQAKEIGLVDQLGSVDDAITLAKSKSNAPDASVIHYRRPFGYTGSVYAGAQNPQPTSLKLELPGMANPLPTGFYYLWNP